MTEISAEQVKRLRAETGAGMMECKRALEEAGGDLEQATRILREQGLAAAAKKRGREASEGLIHAYIHQGGRIGVLVEVNCETDFVARTDRFQELANDVAMQVAAMNPRYVRRDEIDPQELAAERVILRRRAEGEAGEKPPEVLDRIVQGRLEKWCAEVCLEEQPFIRDPDLTLGDRVKAGIAELGENIRVRRFVRFELGEQRPVTVAGGAAVAPDEDAGDGAVR